MKIGFTREDIRSLASNVDVYARGYEYHLQKRLKSINIEKGINTPPYVISAVVEGASDYTVKLLIPNSDIGSIGYNCTCPATNMWRGGCKHVICVLFHLSEGDFKVTGQNSSDYYSTQLNTIFKNRYKDEVEKRYIKKAEGYIKLIPTLELRDDSDVSISLEIGDSYYYIVKNISLLLDLIKAEKEHSYGKSLSFKHSMNKFDDTSQKLISLLDIELELFNSFVKVFYYNKPSTKSFCVTPQFIDKFFEIYKNDFIKITTPYMDKKRYSLTDELPNIKFDLKKSGNSAVLKVYDDLGTIINGRDGDYLLTKNNFYKLSKDYVNTILPIFEIMEKIHDKTITFKDNELDDFITYTMPYLEKENLITSKTELKSQYAELNSTKFYFDTNKNKITLKVIFCYDDTEINCMGNNKLKIKRNLKEEYKIRCLIQNYEFFEDSAKELFVLDDDDLIYELYLSGISDFQEVAEVYVSDNFTQKIIAPKNSKTTYGVRIEGNLLETSVIGGYNLSELIEAVKSYNIKKKYHRLKNGKIIGFEDDGIIEGMNFLSSLGVSKSDIKDDKLLLPKYRTLYLDSILQESENINVNKDNTVSTLVEDFKTIKNVKFKTPKELNNVLRDYQKQGFNWLKTLAHYGFGGILADDMGLGKTIQVITLLTSYINEGKGGISIVVAPTSLIYNWEKEIKKFAPQIKTVVIAGTKSERIKILEDQHNFDTHVLITTYDMLKRDLENYKKIDFQYIIADEAQYIKNPSTQNAIALKSLNGSSKFALTGTPMENSLIELWSIFDFIMKGYLFTQSNFSKNFESKIVRDNDKEASKKLRKLISPFILRRLKEDVLKELPEKVETTLYAEMEPEQKKLYSYNLMKARGELEGIISNDLYGKSQIKILSELTRLRQICCHPSLFIDDYKGGSGKLDLAMQTMHSAISGGHRILLFSQFTTMLDIIKKSLKSEGISYFYMDGATDAKSRSTLTERFNKGEKSVFLISLKAGGTGLNLTGADVVIHYDPWWNPAVMNQASDRAHRYGQEKSVQVINIVAKDSIEEKIIELQNRKKDLVDLVIKEGANFINKMSIEEVKDLFNTH